MEQFSGTFKKVSPSDIVVDHRYQRQEYPSLVYAIAENFQWEAFGIPTVFERNGKYYVADGQQRLAAVRLMPEPPDEVPVVSYPAGELKDEAALFTRINEYRKALSAMEKHKSKVVAEDPAAMAIERAVERAGFTINPGGKSWNDIQAIGRLNRIYNDLGEWGVEEVLVVARESWGDDKAGTGVNMLGLLRTLIIEQGEEYDRVKMVEKLSKRTPGQLRRKAEELRFEMAGSLPVNLRRAVKTLVKL